MRIFLPELFILKLKGKVPRLSRLDWLREMTKEQCLEELRAVSENDFGEDIEAWESWWAEEKKRRDIDFDF